MEDTGHGGHAGNDETPGTKGGGVWLEGAAGRRRIEAGAFPLTVGGPDADIPVPGLDSEAAYFGLAEGEVFVQPAENGAAVTCNGSHLNSSQWLEDGDVVRVRPTRIEIRASAEGWRLVVADASSEEQRAASKPPVVTPPPRAASGGGVRTIRPAEFSPRPLVRPRRARFGLCRRRRWSGNEGCVRRSRE